MPLNWELDEDGQPQVESQEFAEDGGIDVGAAAEQLVASITKESVDTAYMSEAERRLDIAGYYRQLLRGSIFESEEPGARQVEAELRTFAEGRLQVLLGIRADNQPMAIVKPQFTDEEAAGLRKFASMSEADQKVLWALLATASRSKSVVGPAPVKAQQAPAKVVPVQTPEKAAPAIRKIVSPGRAVAPSPVPGPVRQPDAPQKSPQRPRAPTQRPDAPPAPLPMPRGKAMEGLMMQTAISQSHQGGKMDEARRQGRGGEILRD